MKIRKRVKDVIRELNEVKDEDLRKDVGKEFQNKEALIIRILMG